MPASPRGIVRERCRIRSWARRFPRTPNGFLPSEASGHRRLSGIARPPNSRRARLPDVLTVHHWDIQSERIVWLCEELGLEYELKRYDRRADNRLAPDEYKALHPMGIAR